MKPITRKIDGKSYRLSTSWGTKAKATKEADRLRKTGYAVRVIKRFKGYGVFCSETIPAYRTYDGERFKHETNYKNRTSANAAKHYMKQDHPAWRIRIEKYVLSRSAGGAVYAMYVRKRLTMADLPK